MPTQVDYHYDRNAKKGYYRFLRLKRGETGQVKWTEMPLNNSEWPILAAGVRLGFWCMTGRSSGLTLKRPIQ
jgi:hypothetical protein